MSLTLTDEEQASRFELHDEAGTLVGWVDYRPGGPSTILAHTEILGEFEGKGYGGEAVRLAVERIRANGKDLIVTCPFALAYLDRHPELRG